VYFINAHQGMLRTLGEEPVKLEGILKVVSQGGFIKLAKPFPDCNIVNIEYAYDGNQEQLRHDWAF
jgi:hypothetical protein